MGNVQTITTDYPWEWVNGPIGATNYDEAGYIPPGMTYTPQTSWSEPANYGGNKHMRTVLSLPGYGKGNIYDVPWGATEGILTGFGTTNAQGYPQLQDINVPYVQTFVDGQFVNVQQQPVPYAQWKYDKAYDPSLNVCTPATFPDCTMKGMVGGGGEVSFYDHKTEAAGRVYFDSLNRAYSRFFLSGGPEALAQVNTVEHSTYDPCSDPSLLERLIPLGAAAAAVAAFSYYGKPELEVFAGSQVAGAATVVVAGFVYNYSTGLLEYVNEPTNIHFERAARWLVYPGAIAAGVYAGNYAYAQTSQQANVAYFDAAAAAVAVYGAERVLVLPIARIISRAGLLAGLLLGAFGYIMRGVSGFWCRMTTSQDSCTDWTKDELLDSRRWDAVSIASKLTLEVCEREGWQKDDPRAEFVFRGLLTGPGLLEAPIGSPHAATMYDETLVNPLGYLYAGRWLEAKTYTKRVFGNEFQRSANIVGWDGYVAGWGDQANSNLYSCENWDILREGLQTNTHPGTQNVKHNFDTWIGNWENPEIIGKLIIAANTPGNLDKMKRIPGWELQDATLLNYPDSFKKHPDELQQGASLTHIPLEQGAEELLTLPEQLYSIFNRALQAPPPPELRELPVFVGTPVGLDKPTDYCAQVWADLMGDGTQTVQQVHDMLVATLADSAMCNACDVANRGKLEALRIAIDTGSCTNMVNYLQSSALPTGAWTQDAIGAAVYWCGQLAQSSNPALAKWATEFNANGCGSAGDDPSGFSSLSTAITNGWCADKP